jgi:hypothetical protein
MDFEEEIIASYVLDKLGEARAVSAGAAPTAERFVEQHERVAARAHIRFVDGRPAVTLAPCGVEAATRAESTEAVATTVSTTGLACAECTAAAAAATAACAACNATTSAATASSAASCAAAAASAASASSAAAAAAAAVTSASLQGPYKARINWSAGKPAVTLTPCHADVGAEAVAAPDEADASSAGVENARPCAIAARIRSDGFWQVSLRNRPAPLVQEAAATKLQASARGHLVRTRMDWCAGVIGSAGPMTRMMASINRAADGSYIVSLGQMGLASGSSRGTGSE